MLKSVAGSYRVSEDVAVALFLTTPTGLKGAPRDLGGLPLRPAVVRSDARTLP